MTRRFRISMQGNVASISVEAEAVELAGPSAVRVITENRIAAGYFVHTLITLSAPIAHITYQDGDAVRSIYTAV